jgi:gamma-glutamylcyclotransferase (GGCT)/AIG2-like uncharacterized protein YtfP
VLARQRATSGRPLRTQRLHGADQGKSPSQPVGSRGEPAVGHDAAKTSPDEIRFVSTHRIPEHKKDDDRIDSVLRNLGFGLGKKLCQVDPSAATHWLHLAYAQARQEPPLQPWRALAAYRLAQSLLRQADPKGDHDDVAALHEIDELLGEAIRNPNHPLGPMPAIVRLAVKQRLGVPRAEIEHAIGRALDEVLRARERAKCSRPRTQTAALLQDPYANLLELAAHFCGAGHALLHGRNDAWLNALPIAGWVLLGRGYKGEIRMSEQIARAAFDEGLHAYPAPRLAFVLPQDGGRSKVEYFVDGKPAGQAKYQELALLARSLQWPHDSIGQHVQALWADPDRAGRNGSSPTALVKQLVNGLRKHLQPLDEQWAKSLGQEAGRMVVPHDLDAHRHDAGQPPRGHPARHGAEPANRGLTGKPAFQGNTALPYGTGNPPLPPGGPAMSTTDPYFAYGSNLNADDLARCLQRHRVDPQECKPLTRATLPDHELSFGYCSHSRGGGALDVRQRRGSVVEGVLFTTTARAWGALDRKEGVRLGAYERKRVEVILPDGTLTSATTYVATTQRHVDPVRPTQDYLSAVEAGYRHWGLDTSALHEAAEGGSGASWVTALFAYGTLMRQEPRSAAVAAFRPACVLLGRTQGSLWLAGPDFPVMRPEQSKDLVRGEFTLFDSAEAPLAHFDILEGFLGYGHPGNLYRRTLVDVDIGTKMRRAWTYTDAQRLPVRERITTGDWRRHRGVHRHFASHLVRKYRELNADLLEHLWNDRNRWGTLRERPAQTLSLSALEDALLDWREHEFTMAQLTNHWRALVG